MNHDIELFIKHSFKNRSMIKPDEKVSCYYCRTSYLGKYIVEWTDEQQTAICPCGIDSVVPYEVDEETLERASERWFGASFEYRNNWKLLNIPGVSFIESDSK